MFWGGFGSFRDKFCPHPGFPMASHAQPLPYPHRWVFQRGGEDSGRATSILLPARAMTAISNAATSTVAPMGNSLSLRHLRLKAGGRTKQRSMEERYSQQTQGASASKSPPSSPLPPYPPQHLKIHPESTYPGEKAQFRGCHWLPRIFRAA